MDKPFELFLVRHGESETNVNPNKHIGKESFDHLVVLTENGRNQAARCAATLEDVIPNDTPSVFVSPYARAIETWSQISANLKSIRPSEEITDGRLREQEFKDFKSLDELNEKKLRAKQRGKLYYRYKNAESGYDVLNRVGGFYNQLRFDLQIGNRNPCVIIVAHEIVIRCFLLLTLDLQPSLYANMNIENGEAVWLRADRKLKFKLKRCNDELHALLGR